MFHEAFRKALLPRSGEPGSVQGERVRVVRWLRVDAVNEGMENYYGDQSDEKLEDIPSGKR